MLIKRISKEIGEGFSELLFPQICVVCNDLLVGTETGICSICYNNMPYSPWRFNDQNPIVKALWGRSLLSAGFHLLSYRKGSIASRVLHSIKYENQQDLAVMLGRKIGFELRNSGFLIPVDGIVAIPMHPKKQKIRGYNQAELLAKGISEVISKPLISGLLTQTRQTQTQTTKGREDRGMNTGDKYQCNVNFSFNPLNHLLLVDDVMTTGSTLQAAEMAIRRVYSPENLQLSIATLAYVF